MNLGMTLSNPVQVITVFLFLLALDEMINPAHNILNTLISKLSSLSPLNIIFSVSTLSNKDPVTSAWRIQGLNSGESVFKDGDAIFN